MLFPSRRRMRSFQGPHSHCLITAETHLKLFSSARESIFNCMLRQSLIAQQIGCFVYFTTGLLSMLAVILSAVIFCVFYVSMRLFLRFQFKLSVLFVLLQQRRLDFHVLNKLCIYCIHVIMLFIGGFGWISLLYIDI